MRTSSSFFYNEYWSCPVFFFGKSGVCIVPIFSDNFQQCLHGSSALHPLSPLPPSPHSPPPPFDPTAVDHTYPHAQLFRLSSGRSFRSPEGQAKAVTSLGSSVTHVWVPLSDAFRVPPTPPTQVHEGTSHRFVSDDEFASGEVILVISIMFWASRGPTLT